MKVVLVTGGSGGIGSAISQTFASNGYAVIVGYNRNEAKARQLLNKLPGKGHSCLQTNINDSAKLTEAANTIEKAYGKLNVLVNNAGITTPVPHEDLEALTDEWIDRILTTNVKGTFAMTRASKRLLLKGANDLSSSLIVNISSVAAKTGIGSNVMYCASKAAIDSMTRSLARALAPDIRVVSVSPGWVLGEYAKEVDPAYLKMQEELTPLKRLAKPGDVARTVYCVAERLVFTTGSVIPVDGGRPLN